MFTHNLDEPEDLLSYLAEPIRALHEGLDKGVSLADGKMSDLPEDRILWAHLVRLGARMHLGTLEPEEWKLGRDLPNAGIELVRGPIVFRALKSQQGDPPHPGWSRSRKQFWSQQGTLPLVVNGVVMPQGANLILDWHVSQAREVLVALSKPVGVWKYRGAPKNGGER